MKRILITVVALLFATSAQAGAVYSKNASSTTNTEASVAVPGDSDKYPVLIGLSLLAGAAGNDIDFYEADDTSTTLLNAEAAGQTELSLTSVTGFDANDYIVIQDLNGSPIEMTKASAFNGTTNVATVTALANSYQKSAKVYEMKLKFTWDDIGTTRLVYTAPLFAGTKGGPLAAIADTAGILEIETFTVEYR